MDDNQINEQIGKENLKTKLSKKVSIKKSHIIIAGVSALALITGVAVTAGVFIGKETARQQEVQKENETVIIDSSCSADTKITQEFKNDSSGNKVGTIESNKETNIVSVSVSKGDVSLKEGDEYIASPVSNAKNSLRNSQEGSKTWNITILKTAFDKYSGKVRIIAKYTTDPTPTKKYNVTLHTNDESKGNVIGSGTFDENSKVTIGATPTSGNKFEGWYSDPEHLNKVSDDSSYQFEIKNNVELYALFTSTPSTTNKLTLHVNDESKGNVVGTGKYETGSKVKIAAVPTSGNKFSGWYSDSSYSAKLSSNASYEITLNEDKDLYAKFETAPTPKGVVTVTLNDQFPGSEGPEVTTIELNAGEYLPFPQTRHFDNYCFENWYSDSACTQTFNFGNPINSNTELFGKWISQPATFEGLKFTPDDVANPTYYTVMCDYENYQKLPKNVIIPSKYNNKPVTGFTRVKEGNNYIPAFCEVSIESISIPSTFTEIPEYSISYLPYLKNISLPNTIKSIGSYGIYYCVSLDSIDVPESVETIGSYAFYGSGIVSAKLPSNLNKLGEGVFYGCSRLKSIDLSSCNKITEVSSYMFYENTSLEKVILPENGKIVSISYRAFYNCYSLKSIDIPSSVKIFYSQSFYNCKNLMSVNFSSNSKLETIDSNAFYSCSLKSITFPKYIKYINQNSFSGCYLLSDAKFENTIESYCVYSNSINIPEYKPNDPSSEYTPAYLIRSGAAFYRNGKLDAKTNLRFMLVDGGCSIVSNNNSSATSITIPLQIEDDSGKYNVVEISEEAFEEGTFSSLTFEVNNDGVNPNLKNIAYGAFYTCYGLKDIKNIEKCINLETIGAYAFYCVGDDDNYFEETDNLKFDLSNTKVKSIESYAFSYSAIQEIKLPNTLELVGNGAFYCCYELKKADFTKCSNLTVLGYDKDENAYSNSETYGSVFYWCCALEEIDLSNTKIETIPYNTFYYCYNDWDVEGYTFGKTGLKSVKLPDTLVNISQYAFYECELLNTINIPIDVKTVGNYAFYKCKALKTITVDSIYFQSLFDLDSSNHLFDYAEKIYLPEGSTVDTSFTDTFKKGTSTIQKYDLYEPRTDLDYIPVSLRTFDYGTGKTYKYYISNPINIKENVTYTFKIQLNGEIGANSCYLMVNGGELKIGSIMDTSTLVIKHGDTTLTPSYTVDGNPWIVFDTQGTTYKEGTITIQFKSKIDESLVVYGMID